MVDKKILHIVASSIANISNKQIGVLSGNDADLGYPAWGGKDGSGNVTLWLAKEKKAVVSDLKITDTTTTGSVGILQHDSNGDITGKADIETLANVNVSSPANNQGLLWNATAEEWQNGDISGASLTLDDAYNNDTGERLVTVDAGDIKFDINSTYSLNIDLVDVTNNELDGLLINCNTDYFRFTRYTEGSDNLQIHGELYQYDINCNHKFDIDANNIYLDGTNSVNIQAGASGAMLLGALGDTINLNQSGDLGLSSFFSKSSIVGALNELATNLTLDGAYSNEATTTERTIAVDDGDISFDFTGDYDIQFDFSSGSQAGNFTVLGQGTHKFELDNYDDSGYRMKLVVDVELIDIDTNTTITIDSGSSSDFTLGARGSTITLNESGDTSLNTNFTAASIIGALNELLTPTIHGSNGSKLEFGSLSEEVTVAIGTGSAGVNSTTNLVPPNCMMMGISARVTQAPGGGATMFDVTITGSPDVDQYLDDVSTALNTTANSGADNDGSTLWEPCETATGKTLKITTDANVTGTDMKIRLVSYYAQFTDPTS
jgi:hypothetical protein